ncbi:MAG: sigma-54-dependent Fis family transcriptional regulator [Idiomarina sp.]|nr:sigma-54-dependent Fis family transcriptional regulator [Idiomarina sp.]
MSQYKGTRILVIEDDPGLAELLVEELDAEGFRVTHAGSVETARELLPNVRPQLVISDLRLPGADGMSFIPELKALPDAPAILLITAFGTVNQAVAALKQGADDFLTKPLDIEHLLLTVTHLLNHRRLRAEVSRLKTSEDNDAWHGMLGKSRVMRLLFQQIQQVAQTEAPVLILGESGTGKELVAKAVHAESTRSKGPFLAVNCAGIPSELMESEFFGHAAGAFTGAQKARAGLLREAEGGTLLLDEIAEMPLELQAKLLRVLQENKMRPVGSDREHDVNVRILAATHRNLEQRVKEQAFREDLFFRLETLTIQVPALRERGDDRELLAQRFLAAQGEQTGRDIAFGPEAMDRIYQYPFPGNVRELQNAVERAVTFCEGDEIGLLDLPERMQVSADLPNAQPLTNGSTEGTQDTPLRPLSDVQRDYVQHVLREVGGNKRRAAEILGVTRRTLYRWIAEFD